MPSRNTIKLDVAESCYHVYARGNSKQSIFIDEEDFAYFKSLFQRYLTKNDLLNTNGLPYPSFVDELELLAYCLMDNHFHLLVYQEQAGTMPRFMRSLMTSYSMYFNKKYKRTGSLFETRYKASRIDQDSYLQHISRYIHLNPRYWRRYKNSSISTYLGDTPEEWISSQRILDLFENTEEYLIFMKDYEDHKSMLDELKYELADT